MVPELDISKTALYGYVESAVTHAFPEPSIAISYDEDMLLGP